MSGRNDTILYRLVHNTHLTLKGESLRKVAT